MAQEHHEGDEPLRDLDIVVLVAVRIHEPKGVSERELAYGIESEELALLAKVHGAVVRAGGDVLALDELDELGDLRVDCCLQGEILLYRVLQHRG